MKFGVVGCLHGELNHVYSTYEYLKREKGVELDCLLITGDFQATRDRADLNTMAVPDKFKQLHDFPDYASGRRVAPVLTIFVGGNHESSLYMSEFNCGGFVAPNIFYLGHAGVVRLNGVRIGGLSGIYHEHDFLKGHFERAPFGRNEQRSVYHVREQDVYRLLCLRADRGLDVMLTHDWPLGIAAFGNQEELLRVKPYFRAEVEAGTLGSPPAALLLHTLQPRFFFSSHLHVKFAARVPHEGGRETKFLALDKVLPNAEFFQVVDIGAPRAGHQPLRLEFDPEWLAILSKTATVGLHGEQRVSSPEPEHVPPEILQCFEKFDLVLDPARVLTSAAMREGFTEQFQKIVADKTGRGNPAGSPGAQPMPVDDDREIDLQNL